MQQLKEWVFKISKQVLLEVQLKLLYMWFVDRARTQGYTDVQISFLWDCPLAAPTS